MPRKSRACDGGLGTCCNPQPAQVEGTVKMLYVFAIWSALSRHHTAVHQPNMLDWGLRATITVAELVNLPGNTIEISINFCGEQKLERHDNRFDYDQQDRLRSDNSARWSDWGPRTDSKQVLISLFELEFVRRSGQMVAGNIFIMRECHKYTTRCGNTQFPIVETPDGMV